MASAKKCDVCGALYESNKYKIDGKIIKGIWLSTDTEHYAETYGITNHKDLCDDCIELLDDWISMRAIIAKPRNGNMTKCIDCKHLMFSDCYGECSKAYKGVVQPWDSCEKGKSK